MDTRTTDRHATLMCHACGTLNRVELARDGAKPVCGKCAKPIALDEPVR